jgi:tryptophan 2,3-dioxygenase/nucleoside-diphosphate-sugar epimerase
MSWAILGCGYVGTRLARTLLSRGDAVRALARDQARLAPLAALGAEVRAVDAARDDSFERALDGLEAPVVVYSIPPPSTMPPGEAVRRAAAAARAARARRFVYLGSTGVYGATAPDLVVDEATPLALDDADAAPRLADERALAAFAELDTVVLRLAAIYGPGRGLRERLQRGDLRLVDGGAGVFSRIHVEDIVGIVLAAVERAPARAVYCVADDEPSTQRAYVEWLCARLGRPLPPSAAPDPSKPRHAQRGRRVANSRLRRELGYSLVHPTFRHGELAIEREQGAPMRNPFDDRYDAGQTEYERYLKTAELLRLQKDAPQRSHPDELLFQSIHQVEELWMKAMIHELGEMVVHLEADAHAEARGSLDRVSDLAALLERQLKLFERMLPSAYLIIRKKLGRGSGLDSPGFVRLNAIAPEVWAAYKRALARAGVDLMDLYAKPETHGPLLGVAEGLVDFDAGMQRFKREHIMVVRRIIGIGTASLRGNPMDMLERSAQLTYFPELWAVRDGLFTDFKAGELEP